MPKEAKLVNKKTAQEDLSRFFDARKVSESKREDEAAESLIEAIMDGVLTIDESGVITQHLKWPIPKGDAEIDSITYSVGRISSSQIDMKGVKSNDVDGRYDAYIAALTNEVKPVIRKLDLSDKSIGQTIASFFL